MRTALLALVLLTELLLSSAALVSRVHSTLRIWPPQRRGSWQFRYTWVLFPLGTAAFVALGALEWGDADLPVWMRVLLGGGALGAGAGLAGWAILTLGAGPTAGVPGRRLVRSGPYRFTRNPQYLGGIGIVVGYALLAGSVHTLLAVPGAVLWFLTMPLAEEPVLLEEFGDEYRRYAESCPRFVELPDLRNLSLE